MQENYRAVLNSMMKHGIPIPHNGVLHRCLSVIAPDIDESEIQITDPCPSSMKHKPPHKELMPYIASHLSMVGSSSVNCIYIYMLRAYIRSPLHAYIYIYMYKE